jgi:hypothetical protein
MHYRRWIAGALGLTTLGVLVLVVVPPGLSVNNPDRYTAAITPTSAVAGAPGSVPASSPPKTYTVTITNTGSSGKMGSANITLPSAFTITAVTNPPTVPSGEAWTATPSGNTVQLRATSNSQTISPGESISVNVTAYATSAGPHTWVTAARETINFTSGTFTRDGLDPAVTITPADPYTLQFTVQPNDAQPTPPGCTDSHFVCTITTWVKDLDQFGNAEVGVPVSIQLDNNPGNDHLVGSHCDANGVCTELTDADGIAKFSGLTLQVIATSYSLLASSGPTVGLLPAATQTSDYFNIAQTVKSCGGNPCSANAADLNSNISATATNIGGNLSIAIQDKLPSADVACTQITQQVGDLVTVNPTQPNNGPTLEITGTLFHKNNATGVGNSYVCKNNGIDPATGAQTAFHVVPMCSQVKPKNKPPCLVKLSGNGQGDIFFDLLVAYDAIHKTFDPGVYGGH